MVVSQGSISTIAPPNASDGFKTDSALFLLHFFFFFADPTYSCGCDCIYKSIRRVLIFL